MTHVIVTGGSSGIGLELARLYLEQGCRVSLVARRMDVLEAARRVLVGAEDGRVHLAAADVADAAALEAAIRGCEAAHGPCDILITAAGRVDPGFFDAISADLFETQLTVNLMGTVRAVRAVLPAMKERRAGKIMIVSSGAALIGLPGYAAYCASKAALSCFAEALRQEVRPFGVTVCVSYPPDTLTPQYEREIVLRPPEARAIMGVLDPWPVQKVARKIFDGLERGRAEIRFGFSLTMLALFGAFIKPVVFRLAALKPVGGK